MKWNDWCCALLRCAEGGALVVDPTSIASSYWTVTEFRRIVLVGSSFHKTAGVQLFEEEGWETQFFKFKHILEIKSTAARKSKYPYNSPGSLPVMNRSVFSIVRRSIPSAQAKTLQDRLCDSSACNITIWFPDRSEYYRQSGDRLFHCPYA